MQYFQSLSLCPDDSLVAAWDSGVVEFADAPELEAVLTSRCAALLPRFVVCYAHIRALPRGGRRELAHRLKRSRKLGDLLPRRRRRLIARVATSVAGLAMLLALVQSVEAASITVTTTAAGVNDTDGRCSLAEAIINANDDAATHGDCAAGSGADTIVLPKGSLAFTSSYTDYSGATALPVIRSDITITGNRTKMSRAKNASEFRFFAVAALGGNLTLERVTLSGGSAETGGAVLNHGSLTINNSTISGNIASGRGGGIYSQGSSAHVSINGSAFSRNQADVGGAIFNYNDFAIAGSTLSGNTASSEGGAIAHYDGYLRIDDSTISKNRAVRAAAGIDNVYGTVKIFESVITGNSAKYAGGIENYGHGATIGSMMMYHTTVSKNTAGIYGGGVANIDSYLLLSNSSVTGNKATDRGGGVFNNFGATVSNTNSTIAKNKAPTGADVYP
jgi:Chlamydia polymorphic membrane protein (Chlamydia_PMP) repeat